MGKQKLKANHVADFEGLTEKTTEFPAIALFKYFRLCYWAVSCEREFSSLQSLCPSTARQNPFCKGIPYTWFGPLAHVFYKFVVWKEVRYLSSKNRLSYWFNGQFLCSSKYVLLSFGEKSVLRVHIVKKQKSLGELSAERTFLSSNVVVLKCKWHGPLIVKIGGKFKFRFFSVQPSKSATWFPFNKRKLLQNGQ
jgi:hypothetical protein